MRSVYVHIPFCNSICSYCDFCKFLHNDNWASLYLDSLGVFDLNREKILKCLYKNHDFKDNTEVAYIKKKI